jgi:hypothetical protein
MGSAKASRRAFGAGPWSTPLAAWCCRVRRMACSSRTTRPATRCEPRRGIGPASIGSKAVPQGAVKWPEVGAPAATLPCVNGPRAVSESIGSASDAGLAPMPRASYRRDAQPRPADAARPGSGRAGHTRSAVSASVACPAFPALAHRTGADERRRHDDHAPGSSRAAPATRTLDAAAGGRQLNAAIPVMARPRISACTSCVPS